MITKFLRYLIKRELIKRKNYYLFAIYGDSVYCKTYDTTVIEIAYRHPKNYLDIPAKAIHHLTGSNYNDNHYMYDIPNNKLFSVLKFLRTKRATK